MITRNTFFERLAKERRTKVEVLTSLQSAGILDENGEFTKPYENLGRWIKENNPGR